MLAQTIQAFYSIVDCLFIGRASETALTALSIVFPLQLLMLAFAVGAGVGVNTLIAAKLGEGDERAAREYAGVATPLALVMWFSSPSRRGSSCRNTPRRRRTRPW